MNKILVVARREYAAAVKTKAFLISLILMPVMMFGGIFVQKQTQKMTDTSTYRIAVIDRTEGGRLAEAMLAAVEKRNQQITDAETRKKNGPTLVLEIVKPAPLEDKAAVDQQRLDLSEKARDKALLGYVEIGRKFAEPSPPGVASTQRASTTQAGDGSEDDRKMLYSTNQPTLTVFRDWVRGGDFRQAVVDMRAKTLGVDADIANQINNPAIQLSDRGMARTDASGKVSYDSKDANFVSNFVLPVALVMLMFIAVVVGASPLATNIVEEKQLRIAEVLLGGLRPFELMFGKLLGGAATAITLAAIYFAGIFLIAQRMGALQYVRTETIVWFITFALIGVMMYGSLFIAAGAAVTTMKEAQTTLTPIMLIVAMPLMIMAPILQFPSGAFARTLSLIPLTAPTVSIMRAAIPSGASTWELALSAASALIGMLVVVWIAGRIFRVGMLLTSKPASMKRGDQVGRVGLRRDRITSTSSDRCP